MNRFSTKTVLLLSLLLPGLALGGGDYVAGQQKSVACQACHGTDGRSVDPSYPNLAGQHESYLAKALQDYRSGDRSNAIMAGFAANLTDEDIEDLAAFFASQDGLKDIKIR